MYLTLGVLIMLYLPWWLMQQNNTILLTSEYIDQLTFICSEAPTITQYCLKYYPVEI